jgi:hypothetical protein
MLINLRSRSSASAQVKSTSPYQRSNTRKTSARVRQTRVLGAALHAIRLLSIARTADVVRSSFGVRAARAR